MSTVNLIPDAFLDKENNAEMPAEMGTATASIPRLSAGDSDASLEEFEQIARAAHSDPDALAKLRRIIRDNRTIWRDAGDLAHRVMVQISNQLAENDLITFEAIRATLLEKRENIAKEAAGTYPPVVLELLLDQFCCSYLTYYHHQIQVAQIGQSRSAQKFWEVQTTRAQKRLGKSLEFFRLKEQEKSTADSSPSADKNNDENRASKPKQK
jgi:hypothetical protein